MCHCMDSSFASSKSAIDKVDLQQSFGKIIYSILLGLFTSHISPSYRLCKQSGMQVGTVTTYRLHFGERVDGNGFTH